ncbi:FAD-binding domain-containing protein [Cucurbitaria berberidis CBS 394.84]|uniref:FAD-binding domain-containing protein n=1 Tax=Cucurbitaria berberidis CBS 394.84 TaxID=1168544 RepID=A0A9P4GM04_9PLEO|nr:FAD-binding domain-containing protein [Cucurbitaria berberidis CBS 394.84]KAF1848040.1 FAD-binding domain-containing protein [Cucurbitaria berberidis CBS 394.84]
MKASSFFAIGALTAGVFAQEGIFETADFNITEALIVNGVNVSAIPELDSLVERSLFSGCSIACSALSTIYGSTKLLSEGTSTYDAFTSGYWSAQQGTVNPRCVFKPTTPIEVSSLVLLSRLTQCPFAVKGGGHAAFAGASSIDGGITVSMETFKKVTVSSDKKTADIGPGNRWVDVYTTLEKSSVGVVGGRMAPVGVPGLLLGGGISFFSNKLGWACDNIASYEVVTASGIVVTASATSFPDLYWALRGGGNNFGIVTNFKLNAFPLGKMWGGQRIYTENNFPAVLDAIYKFATVTSSQDTDAAQIVSFGSIAQLGKIAIVQMHYAQPVSNASVFNDFNAIQHVQSNTAVSSLADLTIKMNEGAADGLRQTQWDVSFKVNRDLFTFLINTFYTLLPDVQNLPGAFPTISIQAITAGQLKGMQKNGGNALGLDAAKGPYFIMNMSSRWKNAADDAAILKFFSTIIKQVKAEAQKKGLDNAYIYMNYASQFEDPIASYGAGNVGRLKQVSARYDPAGVFQNLHPGHFKLVKGPPNPNMP